MAVDRGVAGALPTRRAILEAAGHHPFARLKAHGPALTGYRAVDALVWCTGQRMAGLGTPEAIIALLAELDGSGLVPSAAWIEVPRMDPDRLAAVFPVVHHDPWTVLWTRSMSLADGDDRVRVLRRDEYAEVDALLDRAFPETNNRTGSPSIHRWFGVRVDGRLAAVAGDRSVNGMGYLVAIAVEPQLRGRGWGAAVTRFAAAQLLLSGADLCALGVKELNTTARGLYERLGFGEGIDLTSVRRA